MQGIMDQINCPHCGKPIELSETLTAQAREHLERDLRLEIEKAQAERYELKLKELTEVQQAKDRKNDELRSELSKSIAEKTRLEERQKDYEIELLKAKDAERQRARKEAEEESRLKIMEKDKQLQDLRVQFEELKRKTDTTSQQLQGEVAELDFENQLKQLFPQDEIKPIQKGIAGADLLQTVYDQNGTACGSIIWEIKRTKHWQDDWIQKLKDDQRRVKASMALLVSDMLPKKVKDFGHFNGVWVSSFGMAMQGIVPLRFSLISLAFSHTAQEGKNEKMELLYRYLSGSEFRARVEAIVESMSGMKQQLDQERRAMNRLWSEREKQIERSVFNMSGMYGDVRGIVGSQLPQIESLTLEGEAAEEQPEPPAEEEAPDAPKLL